MFTFLEEDDRIYNVYVSVYVITGRQTLRRAYRHSMHVDTFTLIEIQIIQNLSMDKVGNNIEDQSTHK